MLKRNYPIMFFPTDKTAPIAVYDSGIGGLSITKVLKKFLPQECIHYIGDTQNFPYGEKTEKELCNYIKQVVNFCLSKRYKLLVIACNTATAAVDHFLPCYLQSLDQKISIINIIDPVVAYIIKANTYRQIALIGTKYTVTNGIYKTRFRSAGITLSSLATPLLAPMIEASFCNGIVDERIIHHYLTQLTAQTIDTLILACTHYIFLKKRFKHFLKDYYQKEITIIDIGQLTALAVQQFLAAHNLANTSGHKLPDCFMATTLTQTFKNASKKLFGQTAIEINLDNHSKKQTLD